MKDMRYKIYKYKSLLAGAAGERANWSNDQLKNPSLLYIKTILTAVNIIYP